jgi:hypothetical protein
MEKIERIIPKTLPMPIDGKKLNLASLLNSSQSFKPAMPFAVRNIEIKIDWLAGMSEK